MSRGIRVTVSAVVIAAMALVLAPAAGAVPVSTGATAYSAAGFTGSASMNASLTLTGTLGGILGNTIGPIVSAALNPLVAALHGTASAVVDGTLGASGSNHVTTPINQGGPAPATFPGDLPSGLPSPCTAASTTLPCYNATTGLSAINVPPLINVGLTAVTGYTQQVPSGVSSTNQIFGRAQAVSAGVSVLPAISSLANPLISTGTVNSLASCPNDGVTFPSAHVASSTINLAGGLVTMTVASDQLASIVVNGVSYASVSALPVVSVGGVVVQPYGTSVEVTLPLTLAQIATGLGLPSSVISTLTNYGIAGTSLKLSLVVGPDTVVTKTTAQAWGLGIGVDLSGSLNFNLLGLVGATVTVPTGITGDNLGNVLDLRLGYTACTVGASTAGAGKAVPPALV